MGQRQGLHTHLCSSSPEFTLGHSPGIAAACSCLPACTRGRQEGDPGPVHRDPQRFSQSQGHTARVLWPVC